MTTDTERSARDAFERGDIQLAATVLLRDYARELFGFLVARMRGDVEAASEVFAEFTEDLWRGLGSFRWQCSARTWCYTLTKHAVSRYRSGARRRSARNVPLSEVGPPSQLREELRTETSAAFRTEARSRITQLREQLAVDDQTLLVLRVNRGLEWQEIAQILSFPEETPDGPALRAESARLRKRFQLVKERLRRMAKEAGILESSD